MDLTGHKYGKLTVVSFSHKDQRNQHCWLCVCECGKTTAPCANSLRRGTTKSCGCGRGSLAHGHSRRRQISPEFRSWLAMRGRCNKPKNNEYARYGGRGVTVCDRWQNSFESFIEDMGVKPTPKHSIERVDGNGNYDPENCRWVTPTAQARNRRSNVVVEWNGERKILIEWSEQVGIKYATLRRRIVELGWPINEAMTSPVTPGVLPGTEARGR